MGNSEANTTLRINVSLRLKKEAQDLADELGLPLSTIISAYLKDFVRGRSLAISALPRLNTEIEQQIIESVADFTAGQSVSAVLKNRPDVARYLRSAR